MSGSLIRGVDAPGVAGPEHPRWADGQPILVGQDVKADLRAQWGQRYRNVHCFVTAVTTDEVTVCPYSEDGWVDPIEVSPSDLRLAAARLAPYTESEET